MAGELQLSTEIDSNGGINDFGYLSAGEHGILLTVTDSSGKSTTESISIEVKDSNSIPTCQITEPQTGDSGEEGVTVLFEATVSDEDISPNLLTVEWSSSEDGVLGTSVPGSDGSVLFPFSELSVSTHVITLSVTDEVGASCVSNLVYTVGSPPMVVLTSPFPSQRYNEGEAITFTAEVEDNEDPASQIDLEWTSSIDGVFSTAGANSNGLAQVITDQLSAGTHIVEVQATDSAGLFTSSSVSLIVNSAPSQPVVSIAPDPAATNDDLQVAETLRIEEGVEVTALVGQSISRVVQ